jgi:hypothetical protein
VVDEIGVQKERRFLFRKVASCPEKAAVQRPVAGAADGCDEVVPVVRSEGADFDPTSVPQRFNRRIRGCFQHGQQPSRMQWLDAQSLNADEASLNR